ncbi:unnamed protein product [Amoebophrya sp. A25]|nr:unnamed protein product [Amoebophrya sp. A25]|eukprot:GSA25T00025424001.1
MSSSTRVRRTRTRSPGFVSLKTVFDEQLNQVDDEIAVMFASLKSGSDSADACATKRNSLLRALTQCDRDEEEEHARTAGKGDSSSSGGKDNNQGDASMLLDEAQDRVGRMQQGQGHLPARHEQNHRGDESNRSRKTTHSRSSDEGSSPSVVNVKNGSSSATSTAQIAGKRLGEQGQHLVQHGLEQQTPSRCNTTATASTSCSSSATATGASSSSCSTRRDQITPAIRPSPAITPVPEEDRPGTNHAADHVHVGGDDVGSLGKSTKTTTAPSPTTSSTASSTSTSCSPMETSQGPHSACINLDDSCTNTSHDEDLSSSMNSRTGTINSASASPYATGFGQGDYLMKSSSPSGEESSESTRACHGSPASSNGDGQIFTMTIVEHEEQDLRSQSQAIQQVEAARTRRIADQLQQEPAYHRDAAGKAPAFDPATRTTKSATPTMQVEQRVPPARGATTFRSRTATDHGAVVSNHDPRRNSTIMLENAVEPALVENRLHGLGRTLRRMHSAFMHDDCDAFVIPRLKEMSACERQLQRAERRFHQALGSSTGAARQPIFVA